MFKIFINKCDRADFSNSFVQIIQFDQEISIENILKN